jgi:hypothetical protein
LFGTNFNTLLRERKMGRAVGQCESPSKCIRLRHTDVPFESLRA